VEYYPARRTHRKRTAVLLLLIGMLVLGAIRVTASVRSTVQSVAVYQGRVALTALLQEAVLLELPQESEGFVTIYTDDAGNVTAVETDTMALSRLQASLTRAVNERLSVNRECPIRLPLGTLTGSYLLMGRGPVIEFSASPVSAVTTELCHRFESAGINQTRHSVVLELSVDGVALLPGAQSAFSVTTQVILTETVVVGVTPERYALLAAGEVL
jgi:sporulation protein YunB